MRVRGELRFIERAIKQGWQTSPEEQQRSIELVVATLDSEQPREVLAALRVLKAITERDCATNSEIRKRAQDALRYHQTKQLTTNKDD